MSSYRDSRRWLATGLVLLGWAVGSTSGFAQGTAGDKPAAGGGSKTAATRPSIYDKDADARSQLASACVRAETLNKRVLLMFGGDWCGWCHKLHELMREDREISKLVYNEYQLVMVDTKAPHAAGLLEECAKGQDGVGFPFLAVMDAKGKLLVGQKTDPLEVGDHHDPKKVKDFLEKWRVAPTDAHIVLKEAIGRAASEDRRVFLTFGAPWCGWCHELEDFLKRPEVAAAMSRDFIIQKIDIERMTAGEEVMKTYRSGSSAGIPWFVILDARGETLATSDVLTGPNPNLGYPATPEEIGAFMTMLGKQVRHMGDDGLAVVRSKLKARGDEIVAEMERRKADAARVRMKAN